MEYEILYSKSSSELSSWVTSRLANGWMLLGPPFLGQKRDGVFIESESTTLYQAMTREAK